MPAMHRVVHDQVPTQRSPYMSTLSHAIRVPPESTATTTLAKSSTSATVNGKDSPQMWGRERVDIHALIRAATKIPISTTHY